jgi:hypothetical protein
LNLFKGRKTFAKNDSGHKAEVNFGGRGCSGSILGHELIQQIVDAADFDLV